jgi:hypothetical protein
MSFLHVSGPTMDGKMGRRLEGQHRLLGVRTGCPVECQGRDRAAVLADVTGREEEKQCLQRPDVVARNWLQLGLPEVDRLHRYHNLRLDPADPLVAERSLTHRSLIYPLRCVHAD